MKSLDAVLKNEASKQIELTGEKLHKYLQSFILGQEPNELQEWQQKELKFDNLQSQQGFAYLKQQKSSCLFAAI